MSMSEAKKRANKKWDEANKGRYDRVQLILPSGKRDAIKAVADEQNISTNEFIRRAIDKYLESLALDSESQSAD